MSEDMEIKRSTGNVFADLGVGEPEEALAKAELARQITEVITRRRLSQREAANLLGVDQPKVSTLMRGRLSGFSTERLFRFLNALGRDVEIIVKPKPRSRRRGRVKVVAA